MHVQKLRSKWMRSDDVKVGSYFHKLRRSVMGVIITFSDPLGCVTQTWLSLYQSIGKHLGDGNTLTCMLQTSSRPRHHGADEQRSWHQAFVRWAWRRFGHGPVESPESDMVKSAIIEGLGVYRYCVAGTLLMRMHSRFIYPRIPHTLRPFKLACGMRAPHTCWKSWDMVVVYRTLHQHECGTPAELGLGSWMPHQDNTFFWWFDS